MKDTYIQNNNGETLLSDVDGKININFNYFKNLISFRSRMIDNYCIINDIWLNDFITHIEFFIMNYEYTLL